MVHNRKIHHCAFGFDTDAFLALENLSVLNMNRIFCCLLLANPHNINYGSWHNSIQSSHGSYSSFFFPEFLDQTVACKDQSFLSSGLFSVERAIVISRCLRANVSDTNPFT